MTICIRQLTFRCLIALSSGLACAFAVPSGANAAGDSSPLPASDYAIHAACPAPRLGQAGCMALQLLPLTAEARAHKHPLGVTRTARALTSGATPSASPANGEYGFTPADLHTAYSLPEPATSTQTIALVDAYNDPAAEADLKSYDKEFGLPECTTANGCFKQINQEGKTGSLPFPQTAKALKEAETKGEAQKVEAAVGWGVEISLDIETAHSICSACKIVLAEANSTRFEDLEAAEEAAVAAGAGEISNSWGGAEVGLEASTPPAFSHSGVVITASAGDDGYLNWDSANSEERGYADFPASSPHVVAVGGTRLEVNEATGAYEKESVWNGDGAGGGGCSEVFPAPTWQRSLSNWAAVGCGTFRAVSDVSADADPYSGVPVRDTNGEACDEKGNPDPGWCTLGGTSLAAPLIAATFALAGGAHEVAYPARTLYENETQLPAALHDVKVGSNAKCTLGFDEATGVSNCEAKTAAEQCNEDAICLAGSNYDGPTGVGTPDGVKAFEPPTGGSTEPEPEPEPEPKEKEKAKEERPSEKSPGEEQRVQEEQRAKQEKIATEERFIAELLKHNELQKAAERQATAQQSTPTIATVPQLSGLGLTLKAIVALNQGRPKVSRIGFTFLSNVPLRVGVTLAKHVRVHGHVRWRNFGVTHFASALPGHNSWRLTGKGSLSAGSYRLMIAAPSVAAKSIIFQIG